MPAPCTWPVIVIALAWLALAALTPRLLINPRGDVETGLAWHFVRLYARLVHRVRFEGTQHVPAWRPGLPLPGPLVVVANHTAGVDPLLIQSACTFEIRWMMLSEMMLPAFGAFWRWMDIIAVGGDVPGSQSARAAIKHLQSGGVVGVFPEGGIERPPGTLMPFEPGVGLLIHKTGARVLPVLIDGTPIADTALQSLVRTSRARVRFLPMTSYAGSGLGPKEIAEDLRALFLRESVC